MKSTENFDDSPPVLVHIGSVPTKQFKLRLPEDQISELEKAAKRYKRRSAQQVADEVLQTYLDFWIQAETVKEKKIEEQRHRMFGEAGAKGRRAG